MSSRKKIFFLAGITLALVSTQYSCGRADESLVVGGIAKCYYEYLISGDYEHFVDGMYYEGEVSDTFRTQLIANAKMFVATQDKRRSKLASVEVDTTIVNEKLSTAEAYLVLHYSDSTKETIMVPMLKDKGVWLMR